MPELTRTSYLCDRCRREDINPSYSERKQWTKIERASDPREERRILLCEKCARDVIKWIDRGLPKSRNANPFSTPGSGPYR